MPEPMPVDGKADVFPRLMAHIEQRAAKGMETYSKPLQTFNGRRPLEEALDEALDLAVYLMQAEMEHEARVDVLRRHYVYGIIPEPDLPGMLHAQCACWLVLPMVDGVDAAVESWIAHVEEMWRREAANGRH